MVTTAGNLLFLDTNILLGATDTTRKHHDVSIALLRTGGIPLCVSGQVFREYLMVATRPIAANGLGLDPIDALSNVSRLRGRLALLEENERVHRLLSRLVERHALRGKRIHDANIAATAIAHGIEGIVTLNPGDFDFLGTGPVEDDTPKVFSPTEILAR
jgi:predicted nucleic acid-binding protein